MTALLGDFLIGTQYLWPPATVTLADFMDAPSFDRPTTTPPAADETFTGSPGFEGGGTFTGAPGFDGEIGELSLWSIGDVSDPYDGGTITIVNPDGTITALNIRANRQRFYTIEIYDVYNERVAVVPGWIRGRLKRQLDKASELSFTIPYDAEGAADLVRPNHVWLRDRWGFVIDTFQIQKRRPTGSGDASYYEIDCVGAIAQLGDEVLTEYVGATNTVSAHVAALMDGQERGNPITVGTIDPDISTIELPFYAVDTNIHAALLSLQMALPRDSRGRMYVDARRRLQWRLQPGDVTEQVITRAANVRSIEAETDYTSLVNRIYMYGEGQDHASRLNLTDAGEAHEYIDDATSITTWGVCSAIKVDRRIRHPETLLKVAQRILEEFATPPVVVSVELLDLAKADDAPIGWNDIEIGGRYRVVDTTLAVDSSVEIVAIETDLARPVPIRVDLANQTRNLSDLISGLVDAIQQPLDVDGDRYPTMGRNYTAQDPRAVRAGDTRWNDGASRGEMSDGTDWQAMGGGIPLYQATSKAGLDNTDIEPYALGFITAGDTQGAWYERNAANGAWVGRTIWEVPA